METPRHVKFVILNPAESSDNTLLVFGRLTLIYNLKSHPHCGHAPYMILHGMHPHIGWTCCLRCEVCKRARRPFCIPVVLSMSSCSVASLGSRCASCAREGIERVEALLHARTCWMRLACRLQIHRECREATAGARRLVDHLVRLARCRMRLRRGRWPFVSENSLASFGRGDCKHT